MNEGLARPWRGIQRHLTPGRDARAHDAGNTTVKRFLYGLEHSLSYISQAGAGDHEAIAAVRLPKRFGPVQELTQDQALVARVVVHYFDTAKLRLRR